MHTLRIAVQERRLVVDNLLQAGAADRPQALARLGASGQIDRAGLAGGVTPPIDELVTAIRLAFERELSWKRTRKLARDREQRGFVATLEFKLDLAERGRALARVDLAAVDGELDCVCCVGERIDGALDPGFEHRLEPPADLLAGERLDAGVGDMAQAGLSGCNLVFPFVAFERTPAAGRLYGLDVAFARAAGAKPEAGPL